MARMKITLFKSNIRKDGSCPVCLRVAKGNKTKYIDLQLSALRGQWNEETSRFKNDKRINPNHENYNALLNRYEVRKNEILQKFVEKRVDWTLNQFEEEFLGMSKQGKVYDYFIKQVENLKATKHIGNGKVYERTLHMLAKYDSKIKERLFSELDVKYVNWFNLEMEKDGCCGNTRKYYLKTLRAVMNKAIKEREASSSTYPFGKGGFEISRLAEETAKRYLLPQDLELIKNSPQQNPTLELSRRLFLFSYYCFGMSFMDEAMLINSNIEMLETGEHIIYKRQKTQNAKDSKPIKIPVTPAIKELLEWFKTNTLLTSDYLLPIVTRNYEGEQLYDHIRSRYKRINDSLKQLGKLLGIRMNLTTYVSRHTMAMTLQGNEVPREIISQALGHRNLATTNVYLDGFSTSVLDRVAKIL
ncbi:site-specific integrase [Bacteroides thetaiotaomicron]|uniref:site-specific integrase n=1 Tax=Bacteroides thetaiotaomicron TaxID=818 RepID=UPI0035662EE0